MYYEVGYYIPESLEAWLYGDLVTEYLSTPLLPKSMVMLIYMKKTKRKLYIYTNMDSFLV